MPLMDANQENLVSWESAAADRDDRGWKPLPQMIVAGSHSHKGATSLPTGRWPVMVSRMIVIAVQSSAYSLTT